MRNLLKVDKTVYQAALRILARREHSKLELTHKLHDKNFDQDKINDVIDLLEQKNFLNNTRFANSYARRRANKGLGKLRIQAELKQRGISKETMADIQWDDQETIKKIYQKKFGLKPMNDLKDKAKRINFLQYKGFGADEIRKVIKWTEE
jgi:regulatory protein